MKRQTKHIKTKKIQDLERLDKAAWLIPLAVFIVIFNRRFISIINYMREDFWTAIITLVFLGMLLGVFYIPLMMIWRAVSRTLKKNAIEQTTFQVLEDFDYFREELTGISPATISMCVDFEIERDKDLAAQLLKFTMQGLIKIDGEQITVLQTGNESVIAQLSGNERFLLSQIAKGNLTESIKSQWAKIACQEVIDGPYIKENKEEKKAKVTGPIGCLPFFIFIVLGAIFLNSSYVELFMALAESGDVSNAELFSLLRQDLRYFVAIAGITFFGIATFVSMVFPFSRTLAEYLNWKNSSLYVRTEQGQILVEEIYGLKNFIHDFSDLEHAQKEALVLWDDFLIYAVLLEENTSIVDEITAMRNLHIINLDYTR